MSFVYVRPDILPHIEFRFSASFYNFITNRQHLKLSIDATLFVWIVVGWWSGWCKDSVHSQSQTRSVSLSSTCQFDGWMDGWTYETLWETIASCPRYCVCRLVAMVATVSNILLLMYIWWEVHALWWEVHAENDVCLSTFLLCDGFRKHKTRAKSCFQCVDSVMVCAGKLTRIRTI